MDYYNGTRTHLSLGKVSVCSEILERELAIAIVQRTAAAETEHLPILLRRRRLNPHHLVLRLAVWASEFGRGL
jgi:hypothetical protein